MFNLRGFQSTIKDVLEDFFSQKYINIAKKVAEFIKASREKAGLSQDQVGERLDIGSEAVSRIERGITTPTLTRLAELADIFKCPIEDLLGMNRPGTSRHL